MNVGFFYVKNSSIPKQVTEQLIEKGIELFNLPLEEKLKIEMVNSKHFLGYARLGAETTAQNRDFREQFDVSQMCECQTSLQEAEQHNSLRPSCQRQNHTNRHTGTCEGQTRYVSYPSRLPTALIKAYVVAIRNHPSRLQISNRNLPDRSNVAIPNPNLPNRRSPLTPPNRLRQRLRLATAKQTKTDQISKPRLRPQECTRSGSTSGLGVPDSPPPSHRTRGARSTE